MRWKDVNYLCHGIEAEVVTDSGDSTPTLVSYHGIIECADYDALPRLAVGSRLLSFEAAVVMLVPTQSSRKSKS